MTDTKKETPETNCDMFKEIALRSMRIRELKLLNFPDPPAGKISDSLKCLSCIWINDCNSQCAGGCEEFEKSQFAAS